MSATTYDVEFTARYRLCSDGKRMSSSLAASAEAMDKATLVLASAGFDVSLRMIPVEKGSDE